MLIAVHLIWKADHEVLEKSGPISNVDKDLNGSNGLPPLSDGPNSDINGNSISPNSGAHLQLSGNRFDTNGR